MATITLTIGLGIFLAIFFTRAIEFFFDKQLCLPCTSFWISWLLSILASWKLNDCVYLLIPFTTYIFALVIDKMNIRI